MSTTHFGSDYMRGRETGWIIATLEGHDRRITLLEAGMERQRQTGKDTPSTTIRAATGLAKALLPYFILATVAFGKTMWPDVLPLLRHILAAL